jgi:hypothetical protein
MHACMHIYMLGGLACTTACLLWPVIRDVCAMLGSRLGLRRTAEEYELDRSAGTCPDSPESGVCVPTTGKGPGVANSVLRGRNC